MILLALLSYASAGSVYINNVRADLLPEMTLTNVTVRFDAQGNVWVDAPNYKVQVLPPAEFANAATPIGAGADAQMASRVAPGQWWLVTEDANSVGQTIEVSVNGTIVRRVSSGDPQIILDLAPWLRPGSNLVIVTPLPSAPGGDGVLNIYAGRGNSLSGTIHLDNPDVRYARRGSDSTGGARQYTLTVP